MTNLRSLFVSLLFISIIVDAEIQSNLEFFELSLEELLNVKLTSTSYFEQARHESASSVSQIHSNNWQQTGFRNLGELLNIMPSTVAPQAHGKSRVVAVRGYFNYSIDSGVATLIDGIPINVQRFGTGMQGIDGFDLSVLENVEMIRGPGSALHGPDAFHGVFALNTVHHQDTGISVSGSIGQEKYSALSTKAHLNSGAHKISAVAAKRTIGDQNFKYPYLDTELQKTVYGKRSNYLSNDNLLLKHEYQMSDKTQFNSLFYSMDFGAEQLLGLGRQLGFDAMQDKDWSNYSAKLTLLKVGGKTQFNSSSNFSFDTYYWEYADKEWLDLSGVSFLGFKNGNHRIEKTWGVKAVNRYHLSENHKIAIGYEFQGSLNELSEGQRIFGDSTADVFKLPQHGIKTSAHSLILDGKLDTQFFSNPASVSYSARLDKVTELELQLSPRLALFYPLSKAQLFKLIMSGSYRKPTSYELYGTNSVAENTQLKPEKLTNLELVWQYQGETSLSSLTIFKNYWDSSIRGVELATPIDGKGFQFQNSNDNEAFGLELEIEQKLEHVQLKANASYISSRNIDLKQSYRAFPDWIANIMVSYNLSDNWYVQSLLRYHHRRTDSTPSYGEVEPKEDIEFFRVDSTIGWSKNQIELTLSIRNLLNRTNYMPAYFDRLAGTPDNGRNASLAFTYSY